MFENPAMPSATGAVYATGAERATTTRPAVQRIDSTHLMAGGRELVIEHAGQEYHLRLTRNDKLILTK
jgi:hemin uptake protein HemP